ncbi:STAS domain-containing protein [Novosphingobium sp. ERW19]|uniref:STAS domain-containing protein n=1 Tax=Novosphingobium sp. ERW19 TaxID=2726186 RepID=UPI001457735D|nr:STAS domain-containing protein [Novosphingobium sp. ERW19]NLR40509.1 STAS domain-containing protein [Novosphingobium sp. ERW19]
MNAQQLEDILEITIDGPRIDSVVAPQLKIDLEQAVAQAPKKIVLDLSSVDFMDSTGLGVFVSLLKKLGPDGAIAVAGVQPAVLRLFQLTRLDTLFRIVDDLPAARALVRG